MILIDLVGAALTLLAIGLLALGGYLLALRLLGDEAGSDPLALAVATLLSATGQALAISLVLGVAGYLRIAVALPLQALWTLLLLRSAHRRWPGRSLAAPFLLLARRTGDRLVAWPALALIAVHAAGSELLRGLLRPPLSWDSLMTHMLLAATWLKEQRITVIPGAVPLNYFGHETANGALWLWWYLAPSHSELYANLAFVPQWLLLGLAAGAIARELGAARSWPLAAYLTVLTPAILRFVATEYVDIFLAGTFAAAAFFALRWILAREPKMGHAALAGIGMGIAAGAKVLGVPYCLALAAAAFVAARGEWRRRALHLALALLLATALGSYFYVRNIALGLGPNAIACAGTGEGAQPLGKVVPLLPRPNSVLDQLGHILDTNQLSDAFLGVTRPQSMELGVGPQSFLLLIAAFLFPLFLPAGRRKAGWVIWFQIVFQGLFWVTVPFANHHHVFANLRYLGAAIGFACAGAVAVAEGFGVASSWMAGLAIAFCAQDLLQLHADMPREVRMTIAFLDLGAAALALSPRLRRWTRKRAPILAAAALLAAILAAPRLGSFRIHDRERAFATEFTAHQTNTVLFAGAWRWLDMHGGRGTVAVSGSPAVYFLYPVMGPRLERRVVYVNINAQDFADPAKYAGCNPRVDPDADAWLANLAKAGVRWVHLPRFLPWDFAVEARWARERPGLFAQRYQDVNNLIFEFLPAANAPSAGAGGGS